MFARLMNERVTLRRPVSRGRGNDVAYEEVLDPEDGGPLRLRGRFDFKRRLIRSKDGAERMTDGAFFFLRGEAPELTDQDLVVRPTGEVFRVEGVSEARLLFSKAGYARADLVRTRTKVPADEFGPGDE